MELLEAGESLETLGDPDFKIFRTVFKRHTPFSIVNIEQVVVNNTIEISKVGDLLMGLYLYVDLPSNIMQDWVRTINSISVYIGEQEILKFPIEYILDFYPNLLASTYSKFSYVGDNFLPLPIPDIPVCSLKYTNMKIKIDGSVRNLKCSSIFVFLSKEDRVFFERPFDLIIHQVQKQRLATDGSVCITHPVKCIFSKDITSNTVTIGGIELVNPDPSVSLYYTNRFSQNNPFQDDKAYLSVDYPKMLGIEPLGIQTARFVNGNVFIFSSQSTVGTVVVYDTTKIFNSNTSYTIKTVPGKNFIDFSSSWFDGVDKIFAAGYTQPNVISINTNTLEIKDRGINKAISSIGNVFSVVVNSSNVYLFGTKKGTVIQKSKFDDPTYFDFESQNNFDYKTRLMPSDVNASLRGFTYAELINETTINLYATQTQVVGNPSIIELINPPNVGSLQLPAITRLSYGPLPISSINTLVAPFANYSSNVVVGNYNYLSPGRPNTPFARIKTGQLTFDSTKILKESQGYQFIAYDGNRYAYLIPGGKNRNITRYDTQPTFSFLRCFCIDTQSMYSSGFLNFSRTSIKFPSGTKGTLYAINYNILRFMNGMANILYAT